jgi:Tfp pilus assembly protein PilE
MSVIDLLITIIVVTILVTIALGVMSYLAYKLRLARRPSQPEDDMAESRYFVIHEPPLESAPETEDTSVAET